MQLASSSVKNVDNQRSTEEDDGEEFYSSDDCCSVASHQSKFSCKSNRVQDGSKPIKKHQKRKRKKLPLKQSGVPGSPEKENQV